jgi:GWxTD domain-containing protein
MIKRNAILSFILVISIAASPLYSEKKLSPEHKNWLETVSPIITKTEREIFLKLETDEERNKFIQVFWKQRDPLPDTAENEFFKDYMERVRFADFTFGRETSKKGSQTERGYFYLLLGPPIERQQFTTSAKLIPLELWYYRGEVKYGLPPYFYLIFYQPQGLGEYRLYHPGVDGPEKLVIPSLYAPSLDRNRAFSVIKEISGELANASLSYLPGERSFGTISSSDTIISGVHALPEKKFSDAYARSYLLYKDYVETDYSHNFIESSFKVKVFKNFNQFFIHWAVEPKKLNFAFYEDKYYAVFQLILRMEDEQGHPVLEKEEEISLKITPDQYKRHERQLFSFQDVLPVISGNYNLFFLIKNKTSKDFTSFQAKVSVPREERAPFLTGLLLYQDREGLGENQKKTLKAFAFDRNQYLINTQNNFLPQNELGLYCQLYNIEEKSDKTVLMEIIPSTSDAPVSSLKKSLREVMSPEGASIDFGALPLSSLNPGYYRVQVSILDANDKKVLTEKENFILLSQPYPVLPWVYSKVHNRFPNPDHLYTLGSQYFMTEEYEHAKDSLEQALKMNDEPKTRLLLAKTLYALGQFQNSLTLIVPVYQASQDREAAKIIAVNYVGLKDWSSALIYLEKLMEKAVEINVLNSAAECYLNLNQPEKALPLLKKSLELDPAQPYIKDLEKRAKKLSER